MDTDTNTAQPHRCANCAASIATDELLCAVCSIVAAEPGNGHEELSDPESSRRGEPRPTAEAGSAGSVAAETRPLDAGDPGFWQDGRYHFFVPMLIAMLSPLAVYLGLGPMGSLWAAFVFLMTCAAVGAHMAVRESNRYAAHRCCFWLLTLLLANVLAVAMIALGVVAFMFRSVSHAGGG